MEQQNYGAILSQKITEFRKQSGLTQEALAGKLGISFQAVSKWENGLSCPDIALLPELADIFGVSVDGLFGRGPKEPERKPEKKKSEKDLSFLPWEDDGTLRAAAFIGRKLVSKADKDVEKIKVIYEGDALNVVSYLNLEIDGNVEGDVSVGNNLSCGGISGGASAGNNVSCGGVSGGASAGNNVSCGGVSVDVSAGSDVKCGDVGRNVTAGGDVTVEGNVKGAVEAQGSAAVKGRTSGMSAATDKQTAAPEKGEAFSFLPWEDDGTLRAAAFIGRKLVSKADKDVEQIKVIYEGDALDVVSYLNLTIEGDVGGDVSAGGGVTVEGDVSGDVNAKGGATVDGDVGGDVTAADGDIAVDGDAGGEVNAGGSVTVEGDVDGDVNTGGSVSVEGDVSGDVSAAGNVTVGGDVSGDVQAEGDVKVEGNIEGGVTIRK